jgi:hypothetical protein
VHPGERGCQDRDPLSVLLRPVAFVVPGRKAQGQLHAAEFVAVQGAEPGQDRLAVLGEQYSYRAGVVGMRGTLHERF